MQGKLIGDKEGIGKTVKRGKQCGAERNKEQNKRKEKKNEEFSWKNS